MRLYKKIMCMGLIFLSAVPFQVNAIEETIAYEQEVDIVVRQEGAELEDLEVAEIVIPRTEEERNVKLIEWEEINLGKVQNTGKTLYYNGQNIPLYAHLNTNYIRESDLYRLGLALENERIEKDTTKDPSIKTEEIKATSASYINNEKIWVENVQSYTLIGDDEIFIPVRALEVYFDLNIAETLSFSDKENRSSKYITIDEVGITNETEQSLEVTLRNIYYDGQQIIQKDWDILSFSPATTVTLEQDVLTTDEEIEQTEMIYISTIPIQIVEDGQVVYNLEYDYGQKNDQIMTYYTKKLDRLTNEAMLDEIFPPTPVIGTMRYATNGFAAGEKVEVLRAKGGYYYYLNRNGQTIQVPWGSVSTPPNPVVGPNDVTKEEIEAYANTKGFTSKTDYFVWTDLYRQRTYVLKKNGAGEWELERNIICSTGKNSNPTPRGNFELLANVPAFGMNKGYMCKNAKQFYGDYLYHSIIYDVTGSYLLEGKGVLGQRASQGCIRFSPEDSVWFYNTLPLGTAVFIN